MSLKMQFKRLAACLGTTCAITFALSTTFSTLAYGDEVKIRIAEDFGNIDPAFWQSATDFAMINVLFPKLIEYKSGTNWEWELSAAESIEQVDDLTIEFTLKPGLMWTNGYGEVTANDVKYSFERYLDAELDSPNKGDWAPLDKVEVTGTHSGVIHLKYPFAALWTSTLPFSGGSIVSEEATTKAGGKFTTDPGATAGTYKIEAWEPRERVVLTPNEGWNGPAAAFDKITLYPIQEIKSAEIAFEAEEIDFTEVAVSSVPQLTDNPLSDSKLEIRASADYTWLGMNLASPKLSDLNVRQAIVKAIDVDTILQGAYFGVPSRANGLIAPGLLGHSEKIPAGRDLEGAKALMSESGVQGLVLELEVQNRSENVTAAQIIQANLADIGIEVVINQLDSGSFWNIASEKMESLELTYKNYASPPDPSWSTQWFLSDQKGVWNWEWFENTAFDDLHAAALKQSDVEKRAAMYLDMQKLMDESSAFVWIMHPPSALLFRDTIVPGLYPNGRTKLADFRPAN